MAWVHSLSGMKMPVICFDVHSRSVCVRNKAEVLSDLSPPYLFDAVDATNEAVRKCVEQCVT